MNATISLEYLQMAHDELLFEIPLNVTAEDISSVASQREYAINPLDARIWLAEWHKSSTEFYALRATDFAALNNRNPNWRRGNPSDPKRWYPWRNTSGNVVGLDPMPIQTTGSTYPFLRLHVSRKTTLTSNGNLPESLQDSDCYVYNACLRHAIERQLSDRITTLEKFYNGGAAEGYQGGALAKEKAAHAWLSVQSPPGFTTWLESIGVPGNV